MARRTGKLGRIFASIGLDRLWSRSHKRGISGRLVALLTLGVVAAAAGTMYSERKPKGRRHSPEYPKLAA